MFVDFEKWHGCKNDFLIVWLHPNDQEIVLNSLKRQASKICDRHSGVGGDGILVLHYSTSTPLMPHKLTIINSDGTIALNCGNGLRCAAMSILRNNRLKGESDFLPELIDLDVEGSHMICRFLESDPGHQLVSIEMPNIESGDKLSWAKETKEKIDLLSSSYNFTIDSVNCYQIGNPHVVIETPDCSEALMLKVGKELQSGLPIDGINVHITQTKDINPKDNTKARSELGQSIGELLDVWVWERGVGPTQACGSGACSVGIHTLSLGFVDRKDWIAIDMPGGRLYTQQKNIADPVTLAGPAEFVYGGKVEI